MRIRGKILFLAGILVSLGAGWLGFPRVIYSNRPQPVEFNHKIHAQKVASLCEDCHVLRGDGSYSGVPRLSQCSGCHAAPLGPTAAERDFIARYVTPKRQPEWAVYSRQPDNVWFSHTPHVKRAKVKCERCHGDYGTSSGSRVYQEDRISGYSRDIWGYTATVTSRLQGATSRPELIAIPGMKMDDCIDCHRKEGLTHSCLDCHK